MAELGRVGACADNGKQWRGKEFAGGCFGSHRASAMYYGCLDDGFAVVMIVAHPSS